MEVEEPVDDTVYTDKDWEDWDEDDYDWEEVNQENAGDEDEEYSDTYEDVDP